MKATWYKSKKVWGTLGALLLYGFGMREGWDPESTAFAARLLFGGVVVEGVIDGLSAFAKAWKGGSHGGEDAKVRYRG